MADLTPDQQRKADKLVELERRGVLDQRPDLAERLRTMRQRGFVAADPFTLADTTPIPFDQEAELSGMVEARLTRPGIKLPPGLGGEEDLGPEAVLAEREARAGTGQKEDPLSFQDNLKLGLSLNPSKELSGILKNRFGSDVPIRNDPNTGRLQFIDPSDNRIASVGKEGTDVGDVGRGLGEAPVIAADIAGTVGAGLLTRSPVAAVAAETTGSAVSTYIGEIAKLSLGKLAGVNEDVTLEQMHESGLKKAAFAGGATAISGTGISLAKGIANFFAGRTFTKEAALRNGLQSQEADAVLSEVNKLLEGTGQQVKATTAKRSGDPLLLGDEAVVRREKEFIREFVERDKSDEQALITAFDQISPVNEAGGEAVVRKFAADKAARIETAENALDQSRQTLQDNLDAIGPSVIDDTGASVRGAISEKRTAVNNQVKRVNGVWLKQAGANAEQTASQVQIPVGPQTRKLMSSLNTESRNAIVNATKSDRSSVFVKKTQEELTDAEKRVVEVRKSVLGDDFVDDLADPSKTSHDLVDYQRAISDLRTTIRGADRNESVSKGQVTVMKRAVKALVKDRDNMLRQTGRDDLFFAIKSADVFTRQARDMLDRSVAGDLMVKSGNRFKVRSQDVFDKGFVKGGKEEAEELFAVIGENQPATQAWRSEILNKYKNTVFPEDKTTKASLKAHKQFMADFGDAMKPFFSKPEMAQVNKLGGIVKVVEKQESQAARILSVLNKTGVPKGATGRTVAQTRKTLSSLEPEQVAPWITSGKTGPARARRVVKLLDSQPKVLDGIRGEVRLNMRNEVAPDGVINPAAFDSHIRKNAATYRDLFDEKYVDNLFTLNKALKITQRRGAAVSQGESLQIPVQIARGTIARPLSKEGRLLTAGLLFKSQGAKRAIARSLLSPDDLEVLARMSQLDPGTRQFTELAASIGILDLTDNELEDQN